MEKVVGRFVRRAAEHEAYAHMSIHDFVQLVEMYDQAFVNITIEHYRNLDELEESFKRKHPAGKFEWDTDAIIQLQKKQQEAQLAANAGEDEPDPDEYEPDPDDPNVLNYPENQSERE